MNKIFALIIAFLFLSSCKQPPLEQAHVHVKKLGVGQKYCYWILIPSEIAGNYCIEYKGDEIPKIYNLPK